VLGYKGEKLIFWENILMFVAQKKWKELGEDIVIFGWACMVTIG
jgi:hypothetical protein